jgi:hypothetical protein
VKKKRRLFKKNENKLNVQNMSKKGISFFKYYFQKKKKKFE